MKTPRVGSAVLAVIRANSPTVGKRPVGRHPDATTRWRTLGRLGTDVTVVARPRNGTGG